VLKRTLWHTEWEKKSKEGILKRKKYYVGGDWKKAEEKFD